MTALSQLISEAKENKTRVTDVKAQEIVNKIYGGYLDEDNVWRVKKSFAPSGLVYGSGACAKRWVLSFQGYNHENKVEPLNAANMKNGIGSHARIQEAMTRSGVAVEIEKAVRSDDPRIFGFADAIIVNDGITYVGEIKTTKHSNFEYRRNTNKIAEYHLVQVLLYMYILGINNGIVIYESKDTNELHAITITMTDEYKALVESVLDWCRKVWGLYEQGVVPARSFRKNSKVCKSCPVEARCNEVEGVLKVERLNITP